ncbi:CYTH domain-containing protein [Desulfovibrio sp. OttesenSCG-928-A18]|nr:CYTH domain-containing protein [Desulfovibrio sp. OttesenSCG-928-A18]
MALEIERKFLLKNDGWRGLAEGLPIWQGYLNSARERTVRVRTVGRTAFLTVKGEQKGFSREEYEYAIPFADAAAMLERMAERPLIEKVRYRIPFEGFVWEIDEFKGENAGLVLAEVELAAEDQLFARPDWLGQEVTHDLRYYNANLVRHPFSRWVDGA